MYDPTDGDAGGVDGGSSSHSSHSSHSPSSSVMDHDAMVALLVSFTVCFGQSVSQSVSQSQRDPDGTFKLAGVTHLRGEKNVTSMWWYF